VARCKQKSSARGRDVPGPPQTGAARGGNSDLSLAALGGMQGHVPEALALNHELPGHRKVVRVQPHEVQASGQAAQVKGETGSRRACALDPAQDKPSGNVAYGQFAPRSGRTANRARAS